MSLILVNYLFMSKKVLYLLILIVFFSFFCVVIYFLFFKNKSEITPTENFYPEKEVGGKTENLPQNNLLNNDISLFFNLKNGQTISWFTPQKNTNYKIENLTDFLSNTSFAIESNFLPFLDEKDFDLFSCQSDSTANGLRLTQLGDSDNPISYTETLSELSLWLEKNPQDIQALYSNNRTSSKVQFLTFENNDYVFDENYEWNYKHASVKLDDGSNKDLYFGMIAYNIIITTSLECAHFASEQLYDLVP